MDLITKIRQDLGFIEAETPEVRSALRELRGNLGRALDSLSYELYSKATHFLLEFIQNADDNAYPSNAVPTLTISLETGWLIIASNEVGFNSANVKALCKIGASTKKNQEGYIGEKGIGFKSVFRIADIVYVLSREYSFFFDKDQELGMIAPTWTKEHAVREGWTTFRLKLSHDNEHHVSSHLAHIQPSLLLFLRKLRHIDIAYEDQRFNFERSQSSGDIILRTTNGSSTASQRLLTVARMVSTYADEPKRSGIEESQLILAFPLTMTSEPVIEDQPVYAYLPIRNYGFKFVIQGDFLTASSREEILGDLPWNIALRDGISSAFADAISQFQSRPTLQFRWLKFIPEGISDSFMRPVEDALLEELKEKPIICCSDSEYRPPSQVLMDPYCRIDGRPLIPPQFLSDHFYISSSYDVSVYRTSLTRLGVSTMSWDILLSGLHNMYNQTAFLEEQDDEWHESVCSHLLTILSHAGFDDRQWQIKSLKIVPLIDGSWTTSWTSYLHFNPSSSDIPLDLGVNFVRPLDITSSRYQLLQRLGVTQADPQIIARRILQIHSNANTYVQRSSLLAHVRYLFDHRYELETILSSESKLNIWVATNDDEVIRSSELYMDHPRYPPELSLSEILQAPFIAAEYMSIYPADSAVFKMWCNWLQDQLGIHTAPRVYDGALSPEFSTILQSLETAKLLRVLRAYWPELRDRISGSGSNAALTELRATPVTCINGSNEKLDATFLATQKLAHFNDLSFLPIADADEPSWRFLELLGVTLEPDWRYSLKRLIRLSQDSDVAKEEVDPLYDQLNAHFNEGDHMKEIRDAFKTRRLVYCARNKRQTQREWFGLVDVVWVAPLSIQSKCQLRWQFPHLQHFFSFVGVPEECPPAVLFDEIKPIVDQWHGKTITQEIYERVSDILLDIDRLLLYASPQDEDPVDLSWLDNLQRMAIFPAHSPSIGLTLLPIRDFYLPDRSGTLAKLFSDDVSIIANPMWLKKPASSLRPITGLLNHRSFKPQLRSLDQAVKVQTYTVGERLRDDTLSMQYSSRVGALERLFYHTHFDQQTQDCFRRMTVYRVHTVDTMFILDDVTRSGSAAESDDIALELDDPQSPDELVVVLGLSCNGSRRDVALSKKIAKLLTLDPAAVFLALTTATDSPQSTFDLLYHFPSIEGDSYARRARLAQPLHFSFHRRPLEDDSESTGILQSSSSSMDNYIPPIAHIPFTVRTPPITDKSALLESKPRIAVDQHLPESRFNVDTGVLDFAKIFTTLDIEKVMRASARNIALSSENNRGSERNVGAGWTVQYYKRIFLFDLPIPLSLRPSSPLAPPASVHPVPESASINTPTAFNDILGEYLVYETLRNHLPDFTVDCWTSKQCGKIPGFPQPPSVLTNNSSAFTYEDVEGNLTGHLFGAQVRKKWRKQYPTYHLDVKTSEDTMSKPFRMSEKEIKKAAAYTITDQSRAPLHVYAIVRVEQIKSSSRSFKIFPDPHKLIHDKMLRITNAALVEVVQ